MAAHQRGHHPSLHPAQFQQLSMLMKPSRLRGLPGYEGYITPEAEERGLDLPDEEDGAR